MRTLVRRRLVAGLAAVATGTVVALGVVATPAHAGDDFPEVTSCEDPVLAQFRGTWQRKKAWGVFAGGAISRDYVPQGLAHDPVRDVFFVSYYDGRHEVDPDATPRNAIIAAFDSRGGYLTHVQVDPANANPEHAHVGGLAVIGDWLVVAETADLIEDGDVDPDPHVFSYKIPQVLRRSPGRLMPVPNNTPTLAASYATSYRGKLYVGSFEDNRLYEYDEINPNGQPYSQGRTFVTPSKTQGAAVAGRFFVFSRSEGRDKASLLTVTDKQPPSRALTVSYEQKIRTMSEGITWAPRNDGTPALFAVFESAATKYADNGGTCATPNLWSIRREIIRPSR